MWIRTAEEKLINCSKMTYLEYCKNGIKTASYYRPAGSWCHFFGKDDVFLSEYDVVDFIQQAIIDGKTFLDLTKKENRK